MNIVKWPAQFLGTVLIVTSIAACDGSGVDASSTPSAAPNPVLGNPAQTPPTGDFVVRGQVYDAYDGLIGGAYINIWVTTESLGYSYGWAYGELKSNEAGRYETVRLPESRISIAAYKDNYVQPCAVDVELQEPARDVEIDVELMSPATFDSFAPPLPTRLTGPAFTGSVFETTPSGKQPVSGAYIAADGFGGLGLVVASTYSDLGGNFFLCNVPAGVWLTVIAAGFPYTEIGPIDPSQPLEIELKRP